MSDEFDLSYYTKNNTDMPIPSDTEEALATIIETIHSFNKSTSRQLDRAVRRMHRLDQHDSIPPSAPCLLSPRFLATLQDLSLYLQEEKIAEGLVDMDSIYDDAENDQRHTSPQISPTDVLTASTSDPNAYIETFLACIDPVPAQATRDLIDHKEAALVSAASEATMRAGRADGDGDVCGDTFARAEVEFFDLGAGMRGFGTDGEDRYGLCVDGGGDGDGSGGEGVEVSEDGDEDGDEVVRLPGRVVKFWRGGSMEREWEEGIWSRAGAKSLVDEVGTMAEG